MVQCCSSSVVGGGINEKKHLFVSVGGGLIEASFFSMCKYRIY